MTFSSVVKMRLEFLQHLLFGRGDLISALRVLGPFFNSFLHGFQIGNDQFRGDDADIAHGIDGAGHVVNILVLETAHDLHNRIDFPDVA